MRITKITNEERQYIKSNINWREHIKSVNPGTIHGSIIEDSYQLVRLWAWITKHEWGGTKYQYDVNYMNNSSSSSYTDVVDSLKQAVNDIKTIMSFTILINKPNAKFTKDQIKEVLGNDRIFTE